MTFYKSSLGPHFPWLTWCCHPRVLSGYWVMRLARGRGNWLVSSSWHTGPGLDWAQPVPGLSWRWDTRGDGAVSYNSEGACERKVRILGIDCEIICQLRKTQSENGLIQWLKLLCEDLVTVICDEKTASWNVTSQESEWEHLVSGQRW